MFVLHQIVNVAINPIFVVICLLSVGYILWIRRRSRIGRWCIISGLFILFFASWPPIVHAIGAYLESGYPARTVESYQTADAILVLGGGVSGYPLEAGYPYPHLTERADRVWYGCKLWHALQSKTQGKDIKIYCTGPDVDESMPVLLKDFGVPSNYVVTLVGPKNTEEEAKICSNVLDGKRVILVTSALHMCRAKVIFEKYAPNLILIPAATDHRFLADEDRFQRWQYYVPSFEAFCLSVAIEHELVGLVRYMW